MANSRVIAMTRRATKYLVEPKMAPGKGRMIEFHAGPVYGYNVFEEMQAYIESLVQPIEPMDRSRDSATKASLK